MPNSLITSTNPLPNATNDTYNLETSFEVVAKTFINNKLLLLLVSSFTSTEIKAFTEEQIPAFTWKQIPAFTEEQIEAFRSKQIQAFTWKQIKAFTKEQIQKFHTWQISAFIPTQIPAFTPKQIKALTPTQIKAFTPKQLPIFTEKLSEKNEVKSPKSFWWIIINSFIGLSSLILSGTLFYIFKKKKNKIKRDLELNLIKNSDLEKSNNDDLQNQPTTSTFNANENTANYQADINKFSNIPSNKKPLLFTTSGV